MPRTQGTARAEAHEALRPSSFAKAVADREGGTLAERRSCQSTGFSRKCAAALQPAAGVRIIRLWETNRTRAVQGKERDGAERHPTGKRRTVLRAVQPRRGLRDRSDAKAGRDLDAYRGLWSRSRARRLVWIRGWLWREWWRRHAILWPQGRSLRSQQRADLAGQRPRGERHGCRWSRRRSGLGGDARVGDAGWDVAANGEDAQPHAGAGSGGGIYLQCDTLAGDASGWLYAKGGVAVGANPGGGSGGGGRIAVDCRWLRWRYTNQVDVSGGTNSAFAYQIGQPGTVYWNITGPHGSSFVIR